MRVAVRVLLRVCVSPAVALAFCLVGALLPPRSLLCPDYYMCTQHALRVHILSELFWHQEIFATLKGVPPANVSREGDLKLEQVSLTDAADVWAGSFSGVGVCAI